MDRKVEKVWNLGMRFGTGRQAKLVEIFGTSELSPFDLATAQPSHEPTLKRIREVHHRIAKLKAIGLRNFEIARMVGFSETRLSTLFRSPAMKELVSEYTARVDAAYEGEVLQAYMNDVVRARMSTARQLADLAEASEEGEIDPLPARTLLTIHDSMADRSGYGKHSVQVNVNLDFATKLDKAVQRSSTIQKVPQVSAEPSISEPSIKVIEHRAFEGLDL